MVKPSGIVGRCALAAVLSIAMVPASALAQAELSESAGVVVAQADATYPNSLTGGSIAELPVTAYWSDVAPARQSNFCWSRTGQPIAMLAFNIVSTR